MFRPERLMKLAMGAWSSRFVLAKLCQLNWLLTTTFSGVGCIELAAKVLLGRIRSMGSLKQRRDLGGSLFPASPTKVETEALRVLKRNGMAPAGKLYIGPAADFCKHTQKVLQKTWPGRCVLKP